MDKLIEYLYSRFLYRDILSYALPGGITLWALAHIAHCHDKLTKLLTNRSAAVAFCFLAYLAGLTLQAVGTFGYEQEGWPGLRFYPVPISTKTPFGELDKAYNRVVIESIPYELRKEYSMTSVERFSALKQIYGNASVALFVVAVACLSNAWNEWRQWHRWVWFVVAVGVVYVLFHEHKRLVVKEHVWRELMVESWKIPCTKP